MSSGRADRQHRRTAVVAVALALTAAAACSGEAAEVSTTDPGSDEVTLTYGSAEDLSSGDAAELRETLEARIEALGIDDASVEVDASGAVITFDPPRSFDAPAVGDVLGTTAELRFRPVLQALSDPQALADLALTPPADDLAAAVIVLDSTVPSAPTIQQPSFGRDSISISGDFSEEEAKALALVLRYGALPTSLTLESVSP